jgi:tRNA nucleotidyltransferase/poly(A) polymerase
MNIEELLIAIKDLASKNGISEPYLVGGIPRDRVMGRVKEKHEIKDVDITTGNPDSHKLAYLVSKAHPESVYREYDDSHCSVDLWGAHFDFSSHFVIPGIEAELTRLGVTEQSEAAKELFSRDFTMNCLLESLDFSKTFDLTQQGIGDINAGLIRCPINPDITIGIDARRILRAIKFAIKFDFKIESRLKDAMLKHRESVGRLPPKFVSAKIDEIVRLDADKGLDMLIEFDLLNLLPLSKMVNDILIQKRKVIHSLSSRRISNRVKVAAVPTKPQDKAKLLNEITAISQQLNNLLKTDEAGRKVLMDKLNTMLTTLNLDIKSMMAADGPETKAPEFWRKNLDYGERKQAFIRGDCGKACPFGLSIPNACKSVGDTILKMTAIEELDEAAKAKYTQANKVVYAYAKERKPCKYADKILADKFNKVDCDYGDTGQGQHSSNWQGSPLYPGTFNSMMLSGIHSKPLGWYADNDSARNMFFGLFSYLGRQENINLVKLSKDVGLALKIIASKNNK